MAPVAAAEMNPDRFAHVLGLAALDLWSELPGELQQALFERSVVLGTPELKQRMVRLQGCGRAHERDIARQWLKRLSSKLSRKK